MNTVSALVERPEPPPAHTHIRPPKFADVLRSEWTKLRSLRSTWLTLATTLVITIGIGVLAASGAAENYRAMSPPEQASFVPTADAYYMACLLGSFAIAVLGILSITGEHSTGMIRTSLAAVPRRTTLLAAKSIAMATAAMLAGSGIALALFGASQLVLATENAPTSALSDPHVLRATIGVVLYFTVFTLLAVAVGTLLRTTAGAIVSMFAFALLIPNVVIGSLPEAPREFLYDYWPTLTGVFIAIAAGENPDGLDPWQGFAVMSGFTALVLGLAFSVFARRDI